jgi:hypothetical protein
MAHGSLLERAAGAAVTVLIAMGAAGSACLDDLPLPGGECEELCQVEEDCGFRSFNACMAASCSDAGTRFGSGADSCMLSMLDDADASDAGVSCADLVFCTCDESCGAVDDCTGNIDPSCGSTCETIVEQDPEVAYQENRCRIESSCEDLALCGGV